MDSLAKKLNKGRESIYDLIVPHKDRVLRPELTLAQTNPVKSDTRKKIPGQVERSDYDNSNLIVKDAEEIKDIKSLEQLSKLL